MSKTIRFIKFPVLLVILCVISFQPAYADTSADLCTVKGVAFVFFNGVNTTPAMADAALLEFRRQFGTTSPAEDPIRYEKLYNYSNGFEDFIETFEQRLQEHGGLLAERFELFFEALSGDGLWWRRIIGSVGSAAGILEGIGQAYESFVINRLTSLFAEPPTAINYLEHRARIQNLILEGKKLLFVAHSQGNLFVNPAYDYALTLTGEESVQVVHIAPASPTLNGPHVLADKDIVINGLRAFGSVPGITDVIPGYLVRPAGANNQKDILGHGLQEIYINEHLGISESVTGYIIDALGSLVAPPANASSGFFTATLTWNGSGDVDLHTFEPNGVHVYYASRQGFTGYLDVDNTSGFGPEHYYATCTPAYLQTGIYDFAVANYYGSTGRVATIQVASWSDGVLGTRSVTLGTPTGSTPAYYMFQVEVSRDEVTGAYSVSIR